MVHNRLLVISVNILNDKETIVKEPKETLKHGQNDDLNGPVDIICDLKFLHGFKFS